MGRGHKPRPSREERGSSVANRGALCLLQSEECWENSPERPLSSISGPRGAAARGAGPLTSTPPTGDRAGRPRAESCLAGTSKALRALLLFDPLIPVLGTGPREIARRDRKHFPPALFMTVKHGAGARPAGGRLGNYGLSDGRNIMWPLKIFKETV